MTPRKSRIPARLLAIAMFSMSSAGGGMARAKPTPVVVKPAGGALLRAESTLEDLVREFEADRWSVTTFYDLPWSVAQSERLEKFYAVWRARMDAIDFESLGHESRIDWLLLSNAIGRAQDELVRTRARTAEVDHLLGFRPTIHELEQARWRCEAVDYRAAATRIDALSKQVRALKERVEKGVKARSDEPGKTEKGGAKKPDEIVPLTVTPSLARRGAEAVDELRTTLRNWYGFYDGYQPEFSWWLRKPHEEASKLLEEYAKLLREEVAGLKGKDEDPLVGEPAGAVQLAAFIRREYLPYTAQELIAIGERELAWGENEMKAASREMGLSDDWKKAMERVKGDFVPPGRQDELVASIAREATEFVRSRTLMVVPPLCEETWRLTMMSPETMRTVPYAAYGTQKIMVAYAKDEMKHEDKLMSMRGNNRHFTRLTTPHELIPGHHLQAFYSARHRTHRRIFGTPFFVEGWGFYCELRLWERGWARTPEDRIGMLFWRMHRAARIIVSLKFHLGTMKPDEMVGFLVDRVGHEKLGAVSEVRRFIGGEYSPLYQVGYMIGGLQLKALHDELVRPGGMSEERFHEAVLSQGPMPIHLLRACLSARPPARDAGPPWRFADR